MKAFRRLLQIYTLPILFAMLLFSCSEGSGIIPSDDLPPDEVSLIRGGGMIDFNGQYYETVIIGDQEWTAANLSVSIYKNGDPIRQGETLNDWVNANDGLWTYFGTQEENKDPYGKLYNALAVVNAKMIAPEGWHVPTLNEWGIMIDYLGGGEKAGGVLKDTMHWTEPNVGATNAVGFSAIPGGVIDPAENVNSFNGLGLEGVYATSDPFPARPNNLTVIKFHAEKAGVQFRGVSIKLGLSVRLIKDE